MPIIRQPGRSLLATLVRQRRLELEMTLAQVAAEAGVSESYLSRIERGERRNLSNDAAINLARALRLDVGEFKVAAGVLNEDELAEISVGKTRQALLADPLLTSEQRAILLNTYEQFTRGSRVTRDGKVVEFKDANGR